MKRFLFLLMSFFIFSTQAFAEISKTFYPAQFFAPQPTSCMTGSFAVGGSKFYQNVVLTITNSCGTQVDLQNSSITFTTNVNLNTSFWGTFGALAYPDNNLQISSQPLSAGTYTSTLSLHFPEQSWANTKLDANKSITLSWGAVEGTYTNSSVKVYVNGTPPAQTGSLSLTNATQKPANVNQAYALVDLILNGQTVNVAQVPWAGKFLVPNLAPGTYSVAPETVVDSTGNSYQGASAPSSITITAGQTAVSTVSYSQITAPGSINIQVSSLPAVLAGYTQQPSIVLTRADTGATLTKSLAWNTTTNVGQLASNINYTFTTPVISYNGSRCTGSFNPATVQSKTTTPVTTVLSYNCVSVTQDRVTINVSGLPSSTSNVNVMFQPSDGSLSVTKPIAISGGSGSDVVNLTDGVIYNVSSTSVTGYTSSFNPQPLTAKANAVQTVSYTSVTPPPSTGGKIMAYMPGWKTPPSAASLAAAGYTHILVAFGVFSTSQPGQIVSAFDTVTKDYITSLHQLGIKVVLSLGGASTSIANTTVDFHQVLASASSPAAFQTAFVNSVKSFMTQYGFDGIDIDIEQGLTASGSFSAPTGDIAVLANIINALRASNPSMLISLVPQSANVAPTSGFSETWGNYASLIMQTRAALSWVGVQVYNTGCVFGLDLICYSDTPSSPNLSVALMAGLLESWPAKTASGQSTGFQPYIGGLNPTQVVLGYPAPNSSGVADGSPAKPTSTIKRAIQCLRTGVTSSTSCDSYKPPRTYPSFGGVFEWEITFDQSNNFKFATDLKGCVLNGTC